MIALMRSQLNAANRIRQVRMKAEGHSMQPLIRPGDTLIISDISPTELRRGQVIALANDTEDKLIVHRLVKSSHNRLLTQGDNASLPDGVFSEANLLGIVRCVERNGRLQTLGFGHEGLIIGWTMRNPILRQLWRRLRGLVGGS
jgi:signal peptidase I